MFQILDPPPPTSSCWHFALLTIRPRLLPNLSNPPRPLSFTPSLHAANYLLPTTISSPTWSFSLQWPGQAFGEGVVKARERGTQPLSLQLLSKPKFSGVEKIKTIGSTYMAATGLNATSGQDTQQVQPPLPANPPGGLPLVGVFMSRTYFSAHHGGWTHLPGRRSKLQPSGDHGGIRSGPGV